MGKEISNPKAMQKCDHCSSPLFAAVRCRVCGRLAWPTVKQSLTVEQALEALEYAELHNSIAAFRAEMAEPERSEPRPVTGKDFLQVAKPQRRQHRGWKCPINHPGCARNCGNYGCGN